MTERVMCVSLPLEIRGTMINNIHCDLYSLIVKDMCLRKYMIFMMSSKYLFTMRKRYIKNVKNYKEFKIHYGSFLKIIFNSNIISYPVITTDINSRYITNNTVKIMLFDYQLENKKFDKFIIQNDISKYLKDNIKITNKYNKSHMISKNASSVFKRFCNVKEWEQININLLDIFESIHHLLYKKYDKVVEIVDNMDIINDNIENIIKTIRVLVVFIDEYKRHLKNAYNIKILMLYIMYFYINKVLSILYNNKHYHFIKIIGIKTEELVYQVKNNKDLPDDFKDIIINTFKKLSINIDNLDKKE